MFFWDPTFVILIPAILLAAWAQLKVRSAYAKYSKVPSSRGYSGADAAKALLLSGGVHDVEIEPIPGELSDHYDPRDKTLRLSEGVYSGRSLAALGIAAHEAGHALQDATAYVPLSLRSYMYPVSSFGSTLAWPIFIIGFFLRAPLLMNLGIYLFSAAVVFTLVTLPVELNASHRAIALLTEYNIVTQEERSGARKVLNAAAWTYVAAAAMAILQLIRMLLLSQGSDE